MKGIFFTKITWPAYYEHFLGSPRCSTVFSKADKEVYLGCGGLIGKETLVRAFTVINKRALFSFPECCFSSPLVITMFLSGKPKGVEQGRSSFHLCTQITSKLLKLWTRNSKLLFFVQLLQLRAQEATQGVIFRIVYFFCPLNQPYKEQSL